MLEFIILLAYTFVVILNIPATKICIKLIRDARDQIYIHIPATKMRTVIITVILDLVVLVAGLVYLMTQFLAYLRG